MEKNFVKCLYINIRNVLCQYFIKNFNSKIIFMCRIIIQRVFPLRKPHGEETSKGRKHPWLRPFGSLELLFVLDDEQGKVTGLRGEFLYAFVDFLRGK